jgi:membrane-associated HD superfamily phosphohydrolase
MSVFLSKLISLLFHPLFMPLLGLCIVLESDGLYSMAFNSGIKFRLYLLFFFLTVLMPLISMFLLVRNKFVSGYHMPKREERFAPYLQTMIYYGMLYYYLRYYNVFGPFCSAILGSMIVLLVMLLVNLRMKISAHSSGAAGVAGIVAAMMNNGLLYGNVGILLSVILIAGLTATARLSLNAHRPIEVYSGLILGFFTEYLVVANDWYI